ncbi:hypothetical protein COL13_05975 [Bacillus cereus]|nr:hypothetical protein COL13_05975 [Bacillus cereus]
MVNDKGAPKGYKSTEIGIIPQEWDGSQTIGMLFDFKNGLNKAKEYFGYGTPIVNYMDVYSKKGLIANDIKGRVSVSSDEIKAYGVRKGDVFFTRTSETPDEIGVTTTILEELEDTVFSGFILRARPKTERLDISYQKFCFSSSYIRNKIVSSCTYTTRALTNGKSLSKIFIPIPPRSEQQAIATALTDVEDLISSLEKLIEKKHRIKQGTMQQLLTGKKRLDGFSGERETIRIGEMFNISAGGDLLLEHFSPFKTEKYRYNIYSNGIANKGLYGYTSNYRYNENTITVTARGTIGYANYRKEKYDAIGRLLILSPIIKVDCLYVSDYINNIIKFVVESTGVPQLTAPQISKYYVTVPSYEEQSAIAQVLANMDEEIEALEKKLNKYKAVKQGMAQELLTGRRRLV